MPNDMTNLDDLFKPTPEANAPVCLCDQGQPEDCPEHGEAYCRMVFEQACEGDYIVPMTLPRTAPSNRCQACGRFPTADEPATRYCDQPWADTENGPSAREIPYVLHDGDCSTWEPEDDEHLLLDRSDEAAYSIADRDDDRGDIDPDDDPNWTPEMLP